MRLCDIKTLVFMLGHCQDVSTVLCGIFVSSFWFVYCRYLLASRCHLRWKQRAYVCEELGNTFIYIVYFLVCLLAYLDTQSLVVRVMTFLD